MEKEKPAYLPDTCHNVDERYSRWKPDTKGQILYASTIWDVKQVQWENSPYDGCFQVLFNLLMFYLIDIPTEIRYSEPTAIHQRSMYNNLHISGHYASPNIS